MDPTTQPINPVTFDLTTIAGIIPATIALVGLIRMWLKDVPLAQRVPVFAYTVAVASGLTWFASWRGWLDGDVGQLIEQAILGALGAAGGFTVLTGSALQSLATLANNARMKTFALLALLLVGGSGCALFAPVAPTPEARDKQRLAAANELFRDTLRSLNNYREAGLIGNEEWNGTIVPVREATAGLLAQARGEQGDALAATLKLVSNELDKLIARKLAAERAERAGEGERARMRVWAMPPPLRVAA
jgi:hypothetical protein